MVLDPLTPPSFPMEPLSSPSLIFSVPGFPRERHSQSFHHTGPEPNITRMLCLPRSISSQPNRTQAVHFLLQYHQETITEAHYFRCHDYPHLHTKLLFALAEQSVVLQHALVAFSALIYSIKVHHDVRALAFLYYSKALQELRLVLNKTATDIGDCLVVVATALQLSSFDVHHFFSLLI